MELFGHVVSVLERAGLPLVVLTPGELRAPGGVEVWRDEAPGLNAAVGAALRRLGAPALIVHADLPHLQIGDVDVVLGSPGDVVVARSRDGGTNGLLMRRLITPSFGPGSALAHVSTARTMGLRARVLDVPGFAVDVDDEPALLSVSGGASYLRKRP